MIFPKILRFPVLSRLATRESARIYQCLLLIIANNRASFQVKHEKVSKYYENDLNFTLNKQF